MPATDSTAPGPVRAASRLANGGIAQDLFAGLTLAAIAVPEQMATARLGHFPPELGFLAFVAGTVGFLLFGASRTVSVGADSTITPIFAASLALLAGAGSPAYGGLAVVLALMVGAFVLLAGVARLGWVANLLSAPVTTGFLGGIAVHIIASQLPVLCGIGSAGGDALPRLIDFGRHVGQANGYAIVLGVGVLILTAGTEKLDHRWPGALIGVAAATIATIGLGLEHHGVKILGVVAPPIPRLPHALPGGMALVRLVPLALLIALIVMVQSSATTRSFPPRDGSEPGVDRDFIGVGIGSILSGLVGSFAVNASPPRTAVVTEAGARSKAAGLVAALSVALLAGFGGVLLEHVPETALAGVLLFVAMRIVRIGVARTVFQESRSEFLLIVATALAIVVLPIETGVAIGIVLSLVHGMWTTTRAKVIELVHVPGTSIWWPIKPGSAEQRADLLVIAFQAPLSFLNADSFRREFLQEMDRRAASQLIVLEAGGIVEIDFTAAHALREIVIECRRRNIRFAIARLESVRATESFERFGIVDLVGRAHVYHSVQEAVDALGARS